MVAYSFQRQFVEPIQRGLKRHTIRADRRRHARLGEELQLCVGMRTKHCTLIGRSICTGNVPIRLCFKANRIETVIDAGEVTFKGADQLNGMPTFCPLPEIPDQWRDRTGDHQWLNQFFPQTCSCRCSCAEIISRR